MGVWGTGLYSGDFAQDLRSAVRAVSRLPFGGERLAEILSATEPSAANNSNDEDHTTFWLVVADQFTKRGIVCESVRAKALDIIDRGTDIAMLDSLGMPPADLSKRQAVLDGLRARLATPPKPLPRPVLKKPQEFLMETGDVYVYPTSRGRCINGYFPSKERIRGWKQDGWGVMLVVECGRTFDFLAWYRPLVLASPLQYKPEASGLRALSPWYVRIPGTLSRLHKKRLELGKIANLPVDREKLVRVFPSLPSGTSDAVNNISIENRLNTDGVFVPAQMKRRPTDLDEILFE